MLANAKPLLKQTAAKTSEILLARQAKNTGAPTFVIGWSNGFQKE